MGLEVRAQPKPNKALTLMSFDFLDNYRLLLLFVRVVSWKRQLILKIDTSSLPHCVPKVVASIRQQGRQLGH